MHSLGGGPISRRGGAREHFLSASFKHHQEHRSHIELFYSWQKSYIEKHLPWIEKVSAFAFQKRRPWKRNKKRSWTYWHMVSLINFCDWLPRNFSDPAAKQYIPLWLGRSHFRCGAHFVRIRPKFKSQSKTAPRHHNSTQTKNTFNNCFPLGANSLWWVWQYGSGSWNFIPCLPDKGTFTVDYVFNPSCFCIASFNFC